MGEISNEILKKGLCQYLDFDLIICTSLSRYNTNQSDKLKQDINAYLDLLRMLTIPGRQRVVINLDDPFADQCAGAAYKVPIVTYSLLDQNADVYSLKIEFSIFETNILLNTPMNLR